MSIEKKSLISTLRTTKKANLASTDANAKPTKVTTKVSVNSMRMKRAHTRRAIQD